MSRKDSGLARRGLDICTVGILLGYVMPTLVDVIHAALDTALFVLFVGVAGWVLLTLELLDQLGVS